MERTSKKEPGVTQTVCLSQTDSTVDYYNYSDYFSVTENMDRDGCHQRSSACGLLSWVSQVAFVGFKRVLLNTADNAAILTRMR